MPSWQHALGLDIDVSPDFGSWLAGFVDGEGGFLIHKAASSRSLKCRLVIKLRDDDGAILRIIRDTLGVGTIRTESHSSSHDQARWAVSKIADIIHVIIPLFEKYPLRAKKARDFVLWARAARLIYVKAHLTSAGRKEILALKEQMEMGRKYRGSTLDVTHANTSPCEEK